MPGRSLANALKQGLGKYALLYRTLRHRRHVERERIGPKPDVLQLAHGRHNSGMGALLPIGRVCRLGAAMYQRSPSLRVLLDRKGVKLPNDLDLPTLRV